MDSSASAKKRGRGISLCTPNRGSQSVSQEKQRPIIPLGQTFKPVRITPFETKKIVYQRPEIQYRNVTPQKVSFSYSQTGRENSSRQGSCIDQQILSLRRELKDKKQLIGELEHKIQVETQRQPDEIKPILTSNREHLNNREKMQNQTTERKFKELEESFVEKFKELEQRNNQLHRSNQRNKQNDQNKKKMLEQRYKQLKWAQNKLLDIIKVCEHGL